MNSISALLFSTIVFLPSAQAITVEEIAISAPSLESPSTLASKILSGKEFSISSDARFVKMSLILSRPQKVSRISLESCSGDFKDGADFFFSPGFREAFSEGGRPILDAKISDTEVPLKSFTIEFRHNVKFCFKSFHITGFSNGIAYSLEMQDDQAKKVADQVSNTRKAIIKNSHDFEKSDLTAVLDNELTMHDESETWVFRFRSDGSFFIRGFGDNMKEARAYSALGKYEVVKVSPKGILIHLKGSRVPTAVPWDGLLVEEKSSKSPLAPTPVDDEIMIENWTGESFMIRNRTSAKKRTLRFSDINAKRASLVD